LGRELKFRDVVAQKTQFAKLHLRNYDLMVAPDAVVRTRSMVLRLASHALICPVFGREHLGGQQLDRLAASIRREGSLALVKSIAGEKLSRSGFESFVLRGLAERGVHFAAAEGKAVWLIAVDDRYYFGFPRFNYHEAPGRQWANPREGSLPPVIAAAMVFASQPGPNETIWDPVMGTGTLLNEATHMVADAKLIGSDLDEQAVRLAQNRFRRAKNVRLLHGDSARISFDGNITLTLANLPFGKQFKAEDGNKSLYETVLRQSLRRAAGNWRACFLTSDMGALRSAADSIGGLAIREVANITTRGVPATISLVNRSQ
jgi:putative RNA methylase family UPF0020